MMKSNSLKQPFSPYFKTVQSEEDSGQEINWRNKSTLCNLFLIVAAVIFCLVMIIIGSIYVDRSLADALSGGNSNSNNDLYLKSLTTGCPGQPILPWYLIIAGALTIILLVGRILICRVCSREDIDSSRCDLSYLLIYDIIFFIITLIWLSVGTHYVNDLHLRKNYFTNHPNQDTCDFGLYWYTFSIIVLGWLTVVLCLVWIVNKYARALCNCITCNKYQY